MLKLKSFIFEVYKCSIFDKKINDMKKQEKALQYAKEAWGVYFDDKHPDSAIEFTQGQITQSDYLAGYNQALRDSCATEMLKMISLLIERLEENDLAELSAVKRAKELIKKTTTI